MNSRLERLDIIRWVAIILMILFHLNFTLVYIYGITIINFSENMWFLIWRISALTFIFVAGISFSLSVLKYRTKIYKKYLTNSLLLLFLALIISLFTYIFIPSQFIIFGILHFFWISFILILLLIKLGYFNFIIWFLVIYFWYFLDFEFNNYIFSFIWWPTDTFISADYYPLFPYFGFLLLWYTTWKFLINKKLINIFKWKYKNKIIKTIWLAWRNSLYIYVIHQPVIIGLIYIFS